MALSYLISTMKENRVGYTQQHFERAKVVRQIYNVNGNSTTENYKHIMRHNIIKLTSDNI